MVEIGRRETNSLSTSYAFRRSATSIRAARYHGILRVFVVLWILILGVAAASIQEAESDTAATVTTTSTVDQTSIGSHKTTPQSSADNSGNGHLHIPGVAQEAQIQVAKTPAVPSATHTVPETTPHPPTSKHADTVRAVESKSTSQAALPVVNLAFPSSSTCPYRTANYITDILPQQCLKTSWTGVANYTTSGVVGGDAVENTSVPASAAAVTSVGEGGSHATGTGTQSGVEADQLGPANPQQTGGLDSQAEAEMDSPLDNSMFLSFEDWKKQNLEKVGQLPENAGHGRSSAEGRRRPAEIDNALDSFGDEGEIHLDFGGFDIGRTEQPASRWSARQERKHREESGEKAADKTAPSGPRNSDAGKTCKERFNYASFDCAATILKTNAKCKSPSSVLVENKDSYMLNECSMGNKFLIVELCDDILVDTVVLANFEFFSSMFRTFRVSVSDRYPVKLDRWRDLGTFEARNTREMQAFLIENPLIWARYLRVEFLSHFGSEFYCPVSLLRVHGTTMIEEVRHQEDASKGYDDIEDEVAESVTHKAPPEPVPTSSEQKPVPIATEIGTTDEKPTASMDTPSISTSTPTSHISGDATEPKSTESNEPASSSSSTMGSVQSLAFIGPLPKSVSRESEAAASSAPPSKPSLIEKESGMAQVSISVNTNSTVMASSTTGQGSESSATSSTSSTSSPLLSSKVASGAPERKVAKPSPASSVALDGSNSRNIATSSDTVRPAQSNVQPHPASPTTQESFFKTMHKRLQSLEANATLSLQYIEEQSRILRDAFQKVEKRQMSKTETFLQHLNDTVMAELKVFRQQYDQLWQSTVIELETHREQYQREIMAISTRLTIVADELVFQKRMAVVQSTLLLLCLGLVIFVRTGGSHLELPIVHQLLGTKSHNMLRLQFDSPPDSPSSKDNSPLRQGRGLQRHSRSRRDVIQGDDSDVPSSSSSPSPSLSKRHGIRQPQSPQSPPTLGFSPPTPSPTDVGDEPVTSPLPADDSPVSVSRKNAHASRPAVELVRQSHSGPATPRGTRDNDPLEWAGSERRRLPSGTSNLSQAMSRSRSSSSGGSIVSDGDGCDPTEGQAQASKTGFDPEAVDLDDVDEAVGRVTNGVVRTKRRNQADNDASWNESEVGHG